MVRVAGVEDVSMVWMYAKWRPSESGLVSSFPPQPQAPTAAAPTASTPISDHIAAAYPGLAASRSPARLKLPLLDPQLRRELGIVAAYLLDDALGLLAPDERLDSVAERVSRARTVVEDDVGTHGFAVLREAELSVE
jgi:hypothetical protein